MLSRITLPFLLCSLAIVSGISVGAVRADTPASTSQSEHSTADRALLARLPRAWEASAPLIGPEPRGVAQSHAQKDPTVVFHDGRWHVFMTVKLADRTAIEYCSFADWKDAQSSSRTLLPLSDSEYFGAPQVFFFRPQQLWYLVYQVGRPQTDKMWVAFSTNANLADSNSWTKAQPMLDGGPNDPRVEGGLDYWIICDEQRAHLFLTNLNGKMWRLSTPLAQFPLGWSDCQLALKGDFFEASHTYRLRGLNQYLTLIEQDGRRYYQAYVADRLDGPWRPLAHTAERPFAGATNIQPAAGAPAWTDNVSHGELLRAGIDETLEVDPDHLQFLFQGMLEEEKKNRAYGQYPWRIGLLTPLPSKP